tara:strand:+ start:988 stop:1209 length:222 start_codon:yes stop_codon:yes gene_type:complete
VVTKSGTFKVKKHFLKIHGTGGTRALSVGKLVPPSWEMVKVGVEKKGRKSITLVIELVTEVDTNGSSANKVRA